MKCNLPKIVALVVFIVNIFIVNSLSILGLKNRPVSDDYCIALASEKIKDTPLVKTLRYSYVGYTGSIAFQRITTLRINVLFLILKITLINLRNSSDPCHCIYCLQVSVYSCITFYIHFF